MKNGFGVDLGGTTVKLAYFDELGTMLDKWEIPTDRSDSGKNILPDIAKAVLALCDGTFGYTTGHSFIVDGGMHIRKL